MDAEDGKKEVEKRTNHLRNSDRTVHTEGNSKILGKVFLAICHVQQQRGEHMKVRRVVVL